MGPLDRLVAAVDGVLVDHLADPVDEAAAVEALRPAMERFLGEAAGALSDRQRSPWRGGAAGYVLHRDPADRFHVMSVVFPPGTSSGVHEHGCWGLIGYVDGLDEEATYRRVDGGDGPDGCVLEKVHEAVHRRGETSRLLPPDEMFHRVRNPGNTDGVSVHVLCRSPEAHPHRFWDRDAQRLVPFPFRVAGGDVVRAELMPD